MIEWTLKKLIGTKNERELKKAWPKVERINALEPKMAALTTSELPDYTARLKEEVAKGRPLDDVLFEAFALVREAARRTIGQRHFDVQLIGGMVSAPGQHRRNAHRRRQDAGRHAARLPQRARAGAACTLSPSTTTSPAATRSGWAAFTSSSASPSAVIVHDLERRRAPGRPTAADITYGQNNEFGFDYLRDNMKFRLQDYVQRELNYAIVDEVDSILIDEARTPLIISGPTEDSTERYYQVDRVIPGLRPGPGLLARREDPQRHRSPTTAWTRCEQPPRRGEPLRPERRSRPCTTWSRRLRAHTLYKRDMRLRGKEGEVLIVDEFTGRLMPGRRWSDGLHQAIEAKEGVKIENENQTLATISFQNYFRMYSKLSGMTGTADTEAAEFATDLQARRRGDPHQPGDGPQRLGRTSSTRPSARSSKRRSKEIEELHEKGQPVLVGTVSIAKSEVVSASS